MATIVREEKRKRGIFGTLMWWVFIAYNVVMLIALFAGIKDAAQVSDNAISQAEKAGAAAGMMLGAGMVMTIWLVGALILGLIVALTRGKTVIVEKITD